MDTKMAWSMSTKSSNADGTRNFSHQAWMSFKILESNKDLSFDCVQSHL